MAHGRGPKKFLPSPVNFLFSRWWIWVQWVQEVEYANDRSEDEDSRSPSLLPAVGPDPGSTGLQV